MFLIRILLGMAFATLVRAVPVPDGVDLSIPPGDDFFAYANGQWLAANPIPAGKDRWGARNELEDVTRKQVSDAFREAGRAPIGSAARRVADFHAAWMNESAIEAKGLAPLKTELDGIARINGKADLVRALGAGLRADVDPLHKGVYDSAHLLGLAVEAGDRGEQTYVAFLTQGGLGLPSREHYVGTEPPMEAVRARYREYIERMLAFGGFDRAKERAVLVMELETAIAKSHATAAQSEDEVNAAGNRWTRADFAREAPGMDWKAFFAAAGLGKQQDFVVWQPSAIKGAAALVDSRPLAAWKDYLRFHVLHRHADVLPRAFAEERLALQDAIAGKPLPRVRADRAFQATQSALDPSMGRMYVERYFPPEYKARVQKIRDNVIAEFRRRVEASRWGSERFRQVALAKLAALRFEVGYPDRDEDAGLVIDPADPVGNLRRIEARDLQRARARLGHPVDRAVWGIPAHKVTAVLYFQRSAYNFPAAFLQSPKFEPAASDAMNYGAIGAIIGHEVSHFVDKLGAEFDDRGARRYWWTVEDDVRYRELSDPLARQMAGYRPFPDVAVDPKAKLTEAVADLNGLAAAFDAHRRALGDRAVDREYVKQQDREFFVGFARSWRAKLSDEAMRKQAVSGIHAPEKYRVATVRNLDAWYDAFDVKPGSRLYLPPAERVRIW